jgi:hypothetical protein
MRILDSEHATMLKYKETQEKKMSKTGQGQKPKGQKWKKQSEELRAILRQNRDVDTDSNSKDGKGGNKPFVNIPSSITEDYLHCDMCNRRYNEQAFTRHIPTCERRTKEALMKSKTKIINANSNGYTNTTPKPNFNNVKFRK